jgi:hypothetical protein
MSRINDIGGMRGFPLPLDTGTEGDDAPPFHADWEAHVFGMMYALIKQRVLDLDEVRDTIERMPVADYLASSYYEKWLHAMTTLLVEKGVLSAAEVSRGAAGE